MPPDAICGEPASGRPPSGSAWVVRAVRCGSRPATATTSRRNAVTRDVFVTTLPLVGPAFRGVGHPREHGELLRSVHGFCKLQTPRRTPRWPRGLHPPQHVGPLGAAGARSRHGAARTAWRRVVLAGRSARTASAASRSVRIAQPTGSRARVNRCAAPEARVHRSSILRALQRTAYVFKKLADRRSEIVPPRPGLAPSLPGSG